MSKLSDSFVAARRQQGWSLEEVEQATRIRLIHLQALEEDDFDLLPSPVYTRGFVRNYATFLGLDPNGMVRLYDDATGYRPEPVRIERQESVRIGSLIAPNVAAVGIAVVLAGILFTWLYPVFFVHGPTTAARLATPLVPTPTPLSTLTLPTATSVIEPTPTLPTPPATTVASIDTIATPRPASQSALSPTPRSSPATGRPGTPTPTIDPNGLALRVKVVDAPSWVQIRSDGVVIFSGTLPIGTERIFTAKNELYIHGGRSDALDLNLNGIPQGRLGSTGQAVVRRTFTRSGTGATASTSSA